MRAFQHVACFSLSLRYIIIDNGINRQWRRSRDEAREKKRREMHRFHVPFSSPLYTLSMFFGFFCFSCHVIAGIPPISNVTHAECFTVHYRSNVIFQTIYSNVRHMMQKLYIQPCRHTMQRVCVRVCLCVYRSLYINRVGWEPNEWEN